jgi:hypothetical protein
MGLHPAARLFFDLIASADGSCREQGAAAGPRRLTGRRLLCEGCCCWKAEAKAEAEAEAKAKAKAKAAACCGGCCSAVRRRRPAALLRLLRLRRLRRLRLRLRLRRARVSGGSQPARAPRAASSGGGAVELGEWGGVDLCGGAK